MRRVLIAIAAACGVAVAYAQPFQLPTLSGSIDETPRGDGYVRPKQIDAVALFNAVTKCYPAPSWFRGEIAAIARMGSARADDQVFGVTGRTYLGIVATIPLYSPVESERAMEREAQRRQAIAQAVAQLHDAATRLAVATRKLALYQALESRSALRVRHGVADTAEQVGYLEKVAIQEEAIAKARSDIAAARLMLRGLCLEDHAEEVDRMIGVMLGEK